MADSAVLDAAKSAVGFHWSDHQHFLYKTYQPGFLLNVK